ncbi:MAG: hypothetical protein QMB63_07970 [Clostridiaceae bacterium]
MTAVFKVEDLSFRLTGSKVLNLNIEISRGEALVISAEDKEGLRDLVYVIEEPALRSGGDIHTPDKYSIIMESDQLDKALKGKDELELAAILTGTKKKRAYELAEQYELTHLLPLKIQSFTEFESYMLKLICSLLNDPKLLILEDPLLKLGVEERTELLNNLNLFVNAGGALLIVTTRPGEFNNLNPKFIDLRSGEKPKYTSKQSPVEHQKSYTYDSEGYEFKTRPSIDSDGFSRKNLNIDDNDFFEVKEKTIDIMPELEHVLVKLPVSNETEFSLRRISIVRFFEPNVDSYILEVRKEDAKDLIKVLKSRGLSPGSFEILPKR